MSCGLLHGFRLRVKTWCDPPLSRSPALCATGLPQHRSSYKGPAGGGRPDYRGSYSYSPRLSFRAPRPGLRKCGGVGTPQHPLLCSPPLSLGVLVCTGLPPFTVVRYLSHAEHPLLWVAFLKLCLVTCRVAKVHGSTCLRLSVSASPLAPPRGARTRAR